jgi:bifunctional UDP-N-acetylglucosamine pyrophosphorylase/glucosamine-1-phosphate N-acetyltransferase
MQSELPKVLHHLNGKSLIEYVVDSLNSAGIDNILVVVGYRGDDVVSRLGRRVNYVWQHEQLGTGHAVMQAEDYFRNYDGDILVACGDVPLIKPSTFRDLIGEGEKENTGAVVLTMIPENPFGYGRIVKDENGSFVSIVEEKDASEEEKKIKEVNSGTYLFNSSLLFEGLKSITNDNAQGEYYLPDVLSYVLNRGYTVKTSLLEDTQEGRGINTREELLELEMYISSQSRYKINE